jgi:hypothetical protein
MGQSRGGRDPGALSKAPAVDRIWGDMYWWGRWDSNPHWYGPKPYASCRWATAPFSTAGHGRL